LIVRLKEQEEYLILIKRIDPRGKGNDMKTKVLTIIAITLFAATIGSASATDGPIDFMDNTPVITYENGYYYLTISEIQTANPLNPSQMVEGWAKMRLNLQNGPLNAQWEMVAAGLTSNVKGTNYAGGRYIYYADKGMLVTFTEYSLNSFGCGFRVGTEAFLVSPITATTAVIAVVDPFETIPITITRTSGTPGDITGTWTFAFGPNTGSMTFNADGTFTSVMNIVQCLTD
jgi:hypothetical protein